MSVPDRRNETAVRAMYERAPYPGLGDDLKDMNLYLDPIRPALKGRSPVRFFDAGCGTGHYLVGVAKSNPTWECCGLDLSQASLDVAKQLAQKHGATVTLKRGSYLEPLPFDYPFDVIAALGTIHHSENPVAALSNLRTSLRDDGFLLFHVYGKRADSARLDIKEMLSIFEPDLNAVERRFSLYQALMRHRDRGLLRYLLTTSPIDVYAALRNRVRNALRRSRSVSWSPGFTERFDSPTAPWIDHFCHPCERTYEVPDIVKLVSDSGLKIVHVLGQGRECAHLIPASWRPAYDGLSREAKMRLSELLAQGGGSFRLILQRAD